MNSDGAIKAFVIILIIIVLLIFSPSIVKMVNSWDYSVHKADDETNYKTLKKVENTCRAMIASYESDKLTYEQYRDSEDEEKRSWAEQAKMRANKTASSYNNYILENSFVWADNVPSDIKEELSTIN